MRSSSIIERTDRGFYRKIIKRGFLTQAICFIIVPVKSAGERRSIFAQRMQGENKEISTSTLKAAFHYDIVGSYLRPERLKQARADYEAAQYVPLSQLCLSTQCGFSSTEEGNLLTEEEQWQKLALVKEIAEEVWG